MFHFGKYTCVHNHNGQDCPRRAVRGDVILMKVECGRETESHDILKKGVFKRLVFDTWKSCKLPNDIVKDEATVDVLGMCIYASPLPTAIQISLLALCWEGSVIFISAWALALLVQQYRAMQEPPSVGRATERFPRFFFMPSVYLLTRTSAHGDSGHKRKN